MKNYLKKLVTAIGTFVLLYAIFLGALIGYRKLGERVPQKAILEVNLETGLVEYVPDDPLARVMLRDKTTVRDLVEALTRAGDDSRVVGLVAHIGAAPMGLAQVQEVRDAVLAFRARNKFTVAFAETFGEFTPGNGAYYLATAFDQVWMQPSGDIGLTGIILEPPFLRGTFEKLDVKLRGDQRYEYKNAFNLYTEKKFTPAHRESMEHLKERWFQQMVRGIAQGRKLSEDQVRALIDRGPFLGREALDAKLVDGLGYRDQVFAEIRKEAGDGARFLYLARYLQRAGRPYEKGKTIALIYGVGAVARGKSEFDPSDNSFTMGSETVAAAFRSAIDDKDVKAILFRVDSPGGSYVASDTIWREVVRARQAGKPVIVSMGNLAGSGGYFVAMSADKIVAQPATVTASIGVYAGKLLSTGFWDKLGISWDEVHSGANAAYWTGTHDYSAQGWLRFQAGLDRIYEDFTSKVAEGRKLPREEVLKIARGRIWTGEDAKRLGLVDELGGIPKALELAKQAAGIAPEEGVELKVFPERKPLLFALFEAPRESSEQQAAVEAVARTFRALQPAVRLLHTLTGESSGVLSMPEVSPQQ